MKSLKIIVLCIVFSSCTKENGNSHVEPTHNFTVERLIILNENNEILMSREQNVWGTPSFVFNQRQYVRESIDSLANAYGLIIDKPELRGYFGYKYEYHPFATRRAFYVAKYQSGTVKIPESLEEVKWMTLDEAIENSIVDAWKEIFKKILNHPNTVWGASFEVYRKGEEHRTRTIEKFYPLFTSE